MALREAEELAEYRDLMETPTQYADGFGWKTVIGALFTGFIMMPGSIYLGLVVGQSMGPAAEWTTIILFTEIARRSFTTLSKQEIYILYYIAGGMGAMIGGLALAGGPFAGLVWNVFLRSAAPAGLGEQVPDWVVPGAESEALRHRTFMHPDWLKAIAVLLFTQILSRVAWITFGYTLFRVLSDGEQLPYPMAPIAAQGATALAEVSDKTETWRWRVFSVGSMLGIAFGMIYVAVPVITKVLLVQPIQILPIPWIDFTQGTEKLLPGVATGVVTNLGEVLVGFVLPFWMIAGSFFAACATMVVNPIAQVTGHMPTWMPGMEATRTIWAASIDIWTSFGIGTAFAVAGLGIYKTVQQLSEDRRAGRKTGLSKPPLGRGDLNIKWCIALFLITTTAYVLLCRLLVPKFPWPFLIIYGYLWTPIESYVNARMIGLTGQWVGFPMIREATFIFSNYKGVDIWFAPIPLGNYGATTQKFREIELTGTKFTSVIKAEILLFGVMMVCSFLFWSYVWRLNPIPSNAYPYTQKFWDLTALQSWLWMSATTEGGSREMFLRAIKPSLMVGGLVFGVGSYALLNWLRMPIMLIYGFIRGLGTLPHFIFPQFIGALIGRYYLKRRFGEANWRKYPPVLYAGFSCGMGLVGMLAVAIALVGQSVTPMPF